MPAVPDSLFARFLISVLLISPSCALCALAVVAAACAGSEATPTSSANTQAVRVSFQRVDKLVFLQAQLNGSRPLWFVLDSGSSRMLVDKKVADALGLKTAGISSVQGAGAGRIQINLIHDVSLKIGELNSAHYEFASIDLSGLTSVVGRPVDGILGYEFLSRFIVTVDYTRQQLIIRDPETKDALPGTLIPIEIAKNWPFIKAQLEVKGVPPITDRFLIDSGSNDAVDHPIIKQTTGNVRQATTGNGLGQPVSGYVGTAEALEIGPFKLKNLTLVCCGATEEVSKLIGSDVLSRFTITFDYPHLRIFLAASPASFEKS
ncbi:MAG: aspartyl protease family protein [Pyrinomonadaceae bacterium]